MQEFDLAIIGGGLAGASLARAMSGSGLRTVVIDNQAAHTLYSSALDNRGLAISYSATQILHSLGVWQLLANSAYPITTVHVSEQKSFGFTKLSSQEFMLPALGYVVSASAIGAALIGGLEQLPDISVMRPIQIQSIDYNNASSDWTLTVADSKLKCKILVGADGSNSFLRSSLNIEATATDSGQSALVTNLGMKQANLSTAYERFLAQGVLAVLPFGEHQVKCVWTADNAQIEELKQLNDQEFLATVQKAFGFRLGRFLSVDVRHTFPIHTLSTAKIHATGVVLIGNAANTLHPVAAQGFNLGLRDVATLSKILKSPNMTLNDYAMQRAKDHYNTQLNTNRLLELFASDLPLAKISRRLGMLAAQFVPSLNRRITAQGTGVWTL